MLEGVVQPLHQAYCQFKSQKSPHESFFSTEGTGRGKKFWFWTKDKLGVHLLGNFCQSLSLSLSLSLSFCHPLIYTRSHESTPTPTPMFTLIVALPLSHTFHSLSLLPFKHVLQTWPSSFVWFSFLFSFLEVATRLPLV